MRLITSIAFIALAFAAPVHAQQVDQQTRQQVDSILVKFVDALILSSRENPKICGIDDTEVVGDLVAVDMPVPRHLLAKKS